MEISNPCICCLLRPSDKNIKTPYTCLGITEIYSDMIEGCFMIQLSLGNNDGCGICDECVGRLRDARDFKLQVQRSQRELLAQLEKVLQIKDEEPPVNPESDLAKDDDDANVIPHDESAVQSEASDDEMSGADYDTCVLPVPNEDAALEPARPSSEPAPCLSARAREQLAMACSVRLERLRDDKAPHTCPTCHDTFLHEASLATHAKDVHGDSCAVRHEDTYTCDTCGKQFTRKSNLIRHIRTHMKHNPTFYNMSKACLSSKKCLAGNDTNTNHVKIIKAVAKTEKKIVMCSKDYKTNCGLKKDQRVHTTPHTCDICFKSFTQKLTLTRHFKIHTGQKPYTCDTCGGQYNWKCNLTRHIKTHIKQNSTPCKRSLKKCPTGNYLYEGKIIQTAEKPKNTCEMCDKQYKRKSDLKKHQLGHNKPFTCDICRKRFTQRSSLIPHLRIHTGEKPYLCEYEDCNLKFNTKSELKSHMRVHTGERPHCCDVCDMKFARKHHLINHKRRHTDEKPNFHPQCHKVTNGITGNDFNAGKTSHATVKPKITCEVCNKQFKRNSLLKQHQRAHTKPYTCDVCKKCFTKKTSLIPHLRIHTGEKPYSCEYEGCNLKSNTKSQLTLHMRVHTGERPHCCDVCDMKFAKKHHMIKHKRRHTGEKPYSCEVCHQQFAQKFTLNVHKRVHTADKPFTCEKCPQKFRHKTDFTQHILLNHPDVKPFACDICHKLFSQQRYANFHKKNMHTKHNKQQTEESCSSDMVNDQFFLCDTCGKQFRSKFGLTIHIIRLHLKQKTHFCEICNKMFLSCSRLQLHKRIHN